MKDVHCNGEKVLESLSVRKNIVELVQFVLFCCVWIFSIIFWALELFGNILKKLHLISMLPNIDVHILHTVLYT